MSFNQTNMLTTVANNHLTVMIVLKQCRL